jgi:predicted RNA-binding Zn-ribbon protein involved in translation (DUF1610 family)
MTYRRITSSIERPALTREWPRPSDIKISAGRLLYRFHHPPARTKWDFRFLREFIALADLREPEFADAVQKYARRWGVLELCAAHDAPTCHPTAFYSHPLTDSPTGICPAKDGGQRMRDFRSEPLSGWRFWSRQAATFLKAVAADQEGRELPREDWLRLAIKGPREAPGLIQMLEARHSLGKDKECEAPINEQAVLLEETLVTRFPWNGGDPLQLISGFANDWLDIANVQLRAVVENGRITMMQVPALESGWLFAAIATQLALIAAKAPKLLLCSSCGDLYIPVNPPRTGARTYCPGCGVKAAWRDASRAYRRTHRHNKQ